MTVFLDSTALLARYLEGNASDLTRLEMQRDPDWCVSSIALSECFMLLDRLGDDPDRVDELRRHMRDDWERMYVIPVDQLCLDTAAELGRNQPIKFVDAIHIAAASRLPKPLTYISFDPNQIPVAMSLDFNVKSTMS